MPMIGFPVGATLAVALITVALLTVALLPVARPLMPVSLPVIARYEAICTPLVGFPERAIRRATARVAPAIEINGNGCIVEWIFFIIYAREKRRIVSLSLSLSLSLSSNKGKSANWSLRSQLESVAKEFNGVEVMVDISIYYFHI
jgi:hypothetical protein